MAEIEKIAVYDARIIQEPAKYAIQKGALSVSTASFQATSATQNQLSFQVLVPSLNVFIDRKIELNTSVFVYSEACCAQSGFTDSTALKATPLSNAPSDLRTAPDVTPKFWWPQTVTSAATSSTNFASCLNSAVYLPYGSNPAWNGLAAQANWTGGGIKAYFAIDTNQKSMTYLPVGTPYDLSPCMFPIQSMCSSMTVTVNDCSVSITGDTLREQLLLAQTRESIHQRTCPSKFDMYAWADDDFNQSNGNCRDYADARDSDVPNGSWPIRFVNPNTGADLKRFDYYVTNGVTVYVINWRPCFIPKDSTLLGTQFTGTGSTPSFVAPTVTSSETGTSIAFAFSDVGTALPVMYRLSTVEPLAISPFLWQDAKQMSEVGLYGITNMTITMTLNAPGAVTSVDTVAKTSGFDQQLYFDRLSNSASANAYLTRGAGIFSYFNKVSFQQPLKNVSTSGPWTLPRVFCTFLTPPTETPLPLVSCVPYVEFPRYITTTTASLSANGTPQVQSNTVTLSSIPDLLVVFVKSSFRGQTQMDTYIPIRQIQVTFDNYSNLCSNYTQEDLYACSVAGGLDMDFDQFRGYARSRSIGSAIPVLGGNLCFDTSVPTAAEVQLTGSPIVLRMGQDIPLSSGLAPGVLGNYSVQVSVTLDNSNGFFNYINSISPNNNVTITIMGVNSGFFESVKGSSAIRKTILNTVDVETAPAAAGMTATQLQRLVGGSGAKTSASLTTSMAVPRISPGVSQGMEEPRRKFGRVQQHGSQIP